MKYLYRMKCDYLRWGWFIDKKTFLKVKVLTQSETYNYSSLGNNLKAIHPWKLFSLASLGIKTGTMWTFASNSRHEFWKQLQQIYGKIPYGRTWKNRMQSLSLYLDFPLGLLSNKKTNLMIDCPQFTFWQLIYQLLLFHWLP